MKVTRRRATTACLVLGLTASWFALMGATFGNIYVEPTDVAIAAAAAARPAGVLAASVEVVLAAAVAWSCRERWLVLLGLPGVLAGGSLLLDPSSHGSAWTYALLSIVPALAVAVFLVLRRRA
jgi:hypothetical protein